MAPLRIVTLILLSLSLSHLVLQFKHKRPSSKPVILMDCSASMTRTFTHVVHTVRQVTFPHTLHPFAESVYAEIPADSHQLGAYTNITQALRSAVTSTPSSIILISDGNHNYGTSPLRDIDKLSIPVFCFGIGSELRKDAWISDVVYPRYTFPGDSITITVVVSSKGFDGGKGSVSLSSNGRPVDREISYFLSNVEAKHTAEFLFSLTQPGEHRLTVDVHPQTGESSYENNSVQFSVHVLEEKISVIYYTDHLSFNTRFILDALQQDRHVNCTAFSRLTRTEYLNLTTRQKTSSIPMLDDTDVLIIDNVNLTQLPWTNAENSVESGLGILCIGRLEGRPTIWQRILPIHLSGALLKGEHHISIIRPFSRINPKDEFPPLDVINGVAGSSDNAVVLAKTRELPLIAYHSIGNGIVFQVNIVDIGTWQFLQRGLKNQDVLTYLIPDIVRFLSPIGQDRRLVLKSLRTEFVTGELVELTLESYDRDFRLVGNGDFYVLYDTTRIPFFEQKKGVYKTSFVAADAGNYDVHATGTLLEESLTSNIITLRIQDRPLEIEDGLNTQLLSTIATKTGGSYHHIDELTTFVPPRSENRYDMYNVPINNPFSYVVMLILLTIDWILRRKKGVV